MEVLLREAVGKLGNRGDVVKVAPGYARNYLFPKRIAVPVTEGNKRQLEIEKRNYEKKQLEARSVADEAKAKIDELVLEVSKRASDNGQLFGSVTGMDVVRFLAEKGFEIERRRLDMEHIKELGEFPVKVRLHSEVSAEFVVRVTRVEE